MKITIATGIFPPEIGGPATYLKYLIPELKKRKWEVDVVTYGQKPVPGVTVISRNLPFLFRLYVFFRAVVEKGKTSDVVFCTDTFSAGLPSVFAKKVLRKPLVIRFAGDFAWEHSTNQMWTKDPLNIFQKKKYTVKIELLKKTQKFVLKNSDGIMVVSDFLRKSAKNYGIRSCELVPNALPLKKVRIDRKKARPRYGLSHDDFVFLSAGRIMNYKGFHELVTVFDKLSTAIPGAKLLIAGDGPEFDSLKQKVKSLENNRNIVLLGHIPEDKMNELMEISDVFVLNSSGETFSFVIYQALFHNLPVITTNVGAAPELVRNGKNGLLYDVGNVDKLKELIISVARDKKLFEKLKKSRTRLPVWDALVKKTVKYVERIVGKRS